MKKECSTCGVEKNATRTKFSEFGWNKGRYRYDCKACVNAKERTRSKARKRLAKTKATEAIERNPHGFLAADIVARAIRDWQKFGHMTEKISMGHSERTPTDLVDATSIARQKGYGTIRDELLAFFASAWFEELCSMANSSPEYIRKHVLGNTQEVE